MNRGSINTLLLFLLTGFVGFHVVKTGTRGSSPTVATAMEGPVENWAEYTAPGSILRDGDGTITVVEFSDFQCPFCARAQAPLDSLVQKYPGRVRVIYRHYPLDIHPQAFAAAEASECAHEQGRFGQYHDLLFTKVDSIGFKSWRDFAVEAGVANIDQFSECLSSRRQEPRVSEDRALADKYKFSGTPTFIINGYLLRGVKSLADFEEHIN